MKKVLLILFVLAICVLAFPQGVMALEDTVIVNANLPLQTFVFEANINNAPPAVWPWVLSANAVNTNNDAINLTVVSSRDWDIRVWDNGGNAAPRIQGHMFANGHPLTNAFRMQLGGIDGNLGGLGPISTSATPGNAVLSGHPLIGAQTDFSDISQTTVTADFGSTGYAITLWFEASEVAVP